MKENAPAGVNCCVPPVAGLRMLVFADGSRTGVMGLDAILEAAYSEGRQPGRETAEEIVTRLAVGNDVPPGAREEYCNAAAEEYARYAALMEERARHAAGERPAPPAAQAGGGGLLARLLRALARVAAGQK